MKHLALALAFSLASLVAVPAMSHASLPAPCLGPANPNGAPPAGFSPLAASDADLACYGFPRRPENNPAALASWTRAMEAAKHWVPGHVVQGPPSEQWANVLSTHYTTWGGYEAPATSNGRNGYSEINADWTVPSGKTTDTHKVGDWIGLSASGGQYPLLQAGAVWFDGNPVTYHFMFQSPYAPGCCAPNYPSTPAVTAGQFVYIDVTWVSPNAQYFLENVSTGSYHTYYQTTSNHSTAEAEAVMEDQTVTGGNGQVAYTNNYSNMTFDDVNVYDLQGFPYSLDTLNVVKDILGYVNPNTRIMAPCALTSSGVFSITSTC